MSAAIELEFVDDIPESRRKVDASGTIVVRSNGRPSLITDTGDRYVAPPSRRSHGTHVKYVIEKCRCAPCTVATREYMRWQRNNGDITYVDATPAREHVLAMLALGCGYKLQSQATGVAEQVYQNLLYGGWRKVDGKRRRRLPAKRIRPATADGILSFRVEHGTAIRVRAQSPKRIPALPVARRWRALLDAGWWVAEASRATGVNRQSFDRLCHGRPKYVGAKVAHAVSILEGLPVPEHKTRWTR